MIKNILDRERNLVKEDNGKEVEWFMTLEQINKELDNLEITDLFTAIKWNLLGSMQVVLENTNKDKLEFYDNRSLDDIVLDIEEQVDELICNSDFYNIESLLEGDICL